MRSRSLSIIVGAAVLCTVAIAARPNPLSAQGGRVDPQCKAGTMSEIATQDACQKAIDIFQFMAPQLAASIAGGNAVLGEVRALGGAGHVSLGLRGNVMRGRLPRVDAVTPAVTGAVASDYNTDEQPVGLPAVDVAIGILDGFQVGGLRLFALDGLLNVAYIPELSEEDVSLRLPEGSLKLSFGGRIGVIQESALAPYVSVSFLRRDLPPADVRATPGSDELAITGFSVTTEQWRLAVGKSFGPLVLAVGGGQDRYEAGATVDVTVQRAGTSFTSAPLTIGQLLDRRTVFADIGLNFPLVKLAVEIGQVSGGTVATYNTFGSARADDALTFASLGLRLHW